MKWQCAHKHEVRKAVTKQKTTRTYARLSSLSKNMGRAVQVNLVKGVVTWRNRISNDALFSAWAHKKWEPLFQHIPWEKADGDLAPATGKMKEAFFSGTDVAIVGLPSPVQSRLRFDTKNPNVERLINHRSAEMVKYVTDSTRETIRDAVRNTFDKAWTPRDVATSIKGSIGLLPQHARAVEKYRNGLIEAKIPKGRVIELSNAYADRLLNYRAMMIGRTETRLAVNYGQLSVWQQAAKNGLVDDKAKKVWIVDGNPCSICEPMDGVAVLIDDAWELDNGDVVDVPTESHPNCYCGMELSFGGGIYEEQESDGDSGDEEDEESE